MRTKRNKNLAKYLPEEIKAVYYQIFTEIIPKNYSCSNPITDPQIRELLLVKGVKKAFTKGIYLRAIVNEYRKTAMVPICSNNRGYWVGNKKEDIINKIESLENRIVGLQEAANGLRNIYNNL